MGFTRYLAMTAQELGAYPQPNHAAWLSCRFDPAGTGLINLPTQLPPDSLIILDDSQPIGNHDALRIAAELEFAMQGLRCTGVVLDFQTETPQLDRLAQTLRSALPCPVAAPPQYAEAEGIVFLPPLPLHLSLEAYCKPWQGREIWLDLAPETAAYTLTAEGCQVHACKPDVLPLYDERLSCRCRNELLPEAVRITLHRGAEELEALSRQAQALGIGVGISLFQEVAGGVPPS